MAIESEPAGVSRRSLSLIVVGTVIIIVLVIGMVMYSTGRRATTPSARQAMVHDMGSGVMPFDLERTTHVFKSTDSGGIQQVITKDPDDQQQTRLIQQHLQHEAIQFSMGNYSDPSRLHGADMPGLKELEAGAAEVKVDYSPLPSGGQLVYTTANPQLISALHTWFAAQVSDHGRDATDR